MMPLYLLRDRDGDFVERIEDFGTATVKYHFAFTKDRAKARRFTHDELWGPSDLAIEFACGFAGGCAERTTL
jgi:hypothetical protein